MIKVAIPRNYSAARKWIVRQIFDRVTPQYTISENQAQNWEIQSDDGTVLWEFEDSIIPSVYKSYDWEMELFDTSEHIDSRIKLIAFRPKQTSSSGVRPNKTIRSNLLPDVFGMAFWLMGRIEEYGREVPKDNLARFSASDSFAFKKGFLLRPIVDEWVFWLRAEFLKKFPSFLLAQSNYRFEISHDVDVPFQFLNQSFLRLARKMAGDLVNRRSLRMCFSRPKQFFLTKTCGAQFDPYFNFDYLMQAAESKGLTATYYFIADNYKQPINGDYDILQPQIASLMQEIHARGHKIGLHPSYDTYLSGEKIGHELMRLQNAFSAANLNDKKVGSRQHFLRFDFFETPQLLCNCGLVYDSSLAFADHVGFRAGTSIPYNYFNFISENELDFQIRPLTLMDVSLIAPWYMNLGTLKKASRLLAELQKNLSRINGRFSVLWHNNQLDTKSKVDIFEYILELSNKQLDLDEGRIKARN